MNKRSVILTSEEFGDFFSFSFTSPDGEKHSSVTALATPVNEIIKHLKKEYPKGIKVGTRILVSVLRD